MKNNKYFIIDFDSTFIQVETLDILAEICLRNDPKKKEKIREIVAITNEGKKLKGKARLNHSLPDAPVQIYPVEGDEIDPDDAVFMWGEVDDPAGGEIESYQVVVECEEPGSRLQVDVPAEILQVTVPPEIFQDQDECKWEVLAIEEYGNRTISETDFDVE